jgi:aldehyde decarbonylase
MHARRDDQILLTALLFYMTNAAVPTAQAAPWWNSKGLVLAALLHAGPVEFLYYWFHRALHHHYLYSRYHSHHHASIVTEPITCMYACLIFSILVVLADDALHPCMNDGLCMHIAAVIHPFAEELVYFVLLGIPLFTMIGTGTASVVVANGYLVYIDFMNYLGHCNFELVPKLLFDVFPPLKYLMYTPS